MPTTTKTIWRVEWRSGPDVEWQHFMTTKGKNARRDALWAMNHYGNERRVLKITTTREVFASNELSACNREDKASN